MNQEKEISGSRGADDEEYGSDAVSLADNGLNELEKSVLQVEKGWWLVASTREQAIRKLTGFTPQQYYLVLSSLIDRPYFWEADPVLVDRLRRLRDKKLLERNQGSQL